MKTLGAPLMLLLVFISAIGPFALNGVLPATSAIMLELSTRYEVAQLVLTVFLLANLLSQLIMGPAADKYGRRPVMLLNLGIFVCGSVICASATSIEWLLVGRFIQGFGGAVCVFLPRTIVRDVYSQGRAASVIGYMTTAMMIAPLFGPAAGGWVTDTFSWRFMYVGLSVLGFTLLISAYRFQPETGMHTRSLTADDSVSSGKKTFFHSSALLLKDAGFIACISMQAGAVGVYYTFLSGAPYVAMESRGLSASDYGIWFVMAAIGYLSGNFVAGRFSERVGVHRMVLLGFAPFMSGICLFWLLSQLEHPLGLFFPMFLVTLSNGMSLPSMITIAMSIRPELAASASGLAGSVQTACGVILSVAVGYALPFNDVWLYVIITASALLSLIGLYLTLRRRTAVPG